MMTSLTKELKMFTGLLEKQGKNMEYDGWRLKYHVMPPVGWLNDPNGLCVLDGKYHLFFQYSPSDPNGSLKYWGHYVSTNLFSWEYKGIVLYPDMPYDCNGVYSGSALVEGEELWLYYTGNVKLSGDYDYIYNGREGNTVLAVMDKNGNVRDKKLLMKNSDYPSNLSCHVRDPKVWRENGYYYMVLGARTKTDKGCILLYESDDRLSWKLKNILETEETFGYMWECPDMFCIDGQRFLSFSPQGLERNGLDYANIYQSGYMAVEGDFTGDYCLGKFKEYDRGFDFYAPQTFEDEDGRRILIGWMGMPDSDYSNGTISRGWQHCMTVPRELISKNGQIYQCPVRELESLRGSSKNYHLCGTEKISVPASSELHLDLIKETGESFSMCIDGGLRIDYDKEKNIFQIQFLPGSNIGWGRTKRGVVLDNLDRLRILLDTSSVEIFINDGQEVFSTRIYPDMDIQSSQMHHIDFICANAEMTVWKLEEKR